MVAGQEDGSTHVSQAPPVRPPEEFIKLDFDVAAAGRGGKGKGKGKGKGRGKRPPPARRHEQAAALRKFARPGVDVATQEWTRGAESLSAYQKDHLNRRQELDQEAVFLLAKGEVLQTAEAGFLQPEGRESTAKLTQAELQAAVPVGVARKCFSFDLPYGPYVCSYTANGRHLLVGGHKGQVALLDCERMHITGELQLKETVRAVQTLHNYTMYATAQKKYVHIYDHTGLELHCLRDHKSPLHLDFLPYHYLLVTAGDFADLRYQDISIGQEVCVHKTRLGSTCSLRHNPRNAVVHAGHANGTVTLWTPNATEPVVKMLAHQGRVTGLAVHEGYMVSSGADGWWKVWDLRKYQALHSTRSFGHAVSDIDVSMTGLLALGFGSHLQIWKDVFSSGKLSEPYMTEEYPGRKVTSVRFRPYEDVCGVGHSDGFGAIIIPGAGFANFDTFEANPFESKRQRREKEVRSLLEKLQPDSIMLDAHAIGDVDKGLVEKYKEEVQQEQEKEKAAAKKKLKKKTRGKGKIGNRMKRKHLQQAKDQRAKTKARVQAEDGAAEGGANAYDTSEDDDESDVEEAKANTVGGTSEDGNRHQGALGRFYGKRPRKT